MRVFTACLATETNTFAPFPTSMRCFDESGVFRGDASLRGGGLFELPARVHRQCADDHGDTLVESIFTFAQPSGVTTRNTYEALRDEILEDLRNASPIDLVLLMLHGAMVADNYDDCEADILGKVRAIVGEDAVIGVQFDPHCHLSETIIRSADIVIVGKEYPHTDFGERAAELYRLCRRVAGGEVRPVAALLDTRMIGFYPTTDPPMSDIVAELRTLEQQAGILSASIAHGFPWGDVADVGTRVLVYSDGDSSTAVRAATGIAERLYAERNLLRIRYPDIETSLDRAAQLSGQVVLGDFADNPGGGAPGDSTFFLAALLRRHQADAVVGCFWDPTAAQICADAGVGATLPLRLGGKCGPMSGDPLDLTVTIRNVVSDHSQGFLGGRQRLGLSAWIRTADIDIAICSIRSQVFDRSAFTGLGITLDDKRLIVVKSSNHYQAGFRAGADHLWHVGTPGALSMNFESLAYQKRSLDFFPRDPDPWASSGRPCPIEVIPRRR